MVFDSNLFFFRQCNIYILVLKSIKTLQFCLSLNLLLTRTFGRKYTYLYITRVTTVRAGNDRNRSYVAARTMMIKLLLLPYYKKK